MSIDSALGAVQSITTTLGGAANMLARISTDLGGKSTSAGASWVDQLRPASYRGVPFGVLGGSGKFGRRNAVHEYPFRDTAWVEDMGRAARHINVSGFLVGADVIAQRERMIASAEASGDGELIHPTLGRMLVSLISFSTEEQWDHGRVFKVEFSFIEAGRREFPAVQTSTKDAVSVAADAANAAAKKDFIGAVGAALKQGAAVVAQAASTAAAWGRQAQRLANDATNLYNMVKSLPGQLGRFNGASGIVAAAGSINSVTGLIAAGSAARGAVSIAIDKLSSAASGLGL